MTPDLLVLSGENEQYALLQSKTDSLTRLQRQRIDCLLSGLEGHPCWCGGLLGWQRVGPQEAPPTSGPSGALCLRALRRSPPQEPPQPQAPQEAPASGPAQGLQPSTGWLPTRRPPPSSFKKINVIFPSLSHRHVGEVPGPGEQEALGLPRKGVSFGLQACYCVSVVSSV